ncbi:MAG TPA: T9SS type A sorting domain-containing protein, partial [Cytophagales bacterium]|nr:T9SS type A sorting domain-containing protein [Cytophagales bacterium]
VSHNVSLPAGQYAIGLASSTGGLNINRITITNNLAARLGADEESEAASTNLVLYPNPVESDLFFTEIPEGAKVVVRNLRGEQVLKGSVEDKSINLSALKSGLYIIFINDGKTIKAKQIIKK